MWIFSTLSLLFVSSQVECWKFLHFGRSSGGNLGKPHSQKLVNSVIIPEQWFTQKLDHFSPKNEITWKQVLFSYFN